MAPIIPQQGERALVVGKTGSGKTVGAIWLLRRIEAAPAIIYDTKIEPKFLTLPNSRVAHTMGDVMNLVDEGESDYIVVRPPIDYMDNPTALDEMLLWHYHNLEGLPAYLDEAYTFHKNSQAGPGLMALMTRGRSKGITTIVSSQRPSRISRFCITEIDKAFVYRLQDKLDRKRLDDLIPDFSEQRQPKRFHFYYFDAQETEDDAGNEIPPKLMAPVSLDEIGNVGYTDSNGDEASREPEKKSRVWL